MVAIDPITPMIVKICFGILILALILRYLKMPSVVTYILAGIALGGSGFGLIENTSIISTMSTLGVILLLFFLGLEISIKKILEYWKISLIGGTFQILFSFLFIFLLGYFFAWGIEKIVLFSFIITLSSTAVVIKVLENFNEINSKVGRSALNILIFQDIIVIPMIIILGFFGSELPTTQTITLQVLGFALIIGLLYWINKKGTLNLKFIAKFKDDPEMQVFVALGICFGFAMLTGLFEISTALGAFIAGMVLAHTKETKWIHDALLPFHTVFIAIFFLSIGLLIDLRFVYENLAIIGLLVLVAFSVNTLINATILRASKLSWRESIYGGVLLSQVGEFSFILSSIGLQIGVITTYGYNIAIATISTSLLLTPPLVIIVRKYLCKLPIKPEITKTN